MYKMYIFWFQWVIENKSEVMSYHMNCLLHFIEFFNPTLTNLTSEIFDLENFGIFLLLLLVASLGPRLRIWPISPVISSSRVHPHLQHPNHHKSRSQQALQQLARLGIWCCLLVKNITHVFCCCCGNKNPLKPAILRETSMGTCFY